MLLFTLQVAVAGVGWIAGHMIATRTTDRPAADLVPRRRVTYLTGR